MIYPKLFHRDNNENLRVWYMEQEGSKYRTYSGVEGGKIIVSDWKDAFAKNVGKANATTPEAQAKAEIEAIYKNKKDRKYSDDPKKAAKSNFLQPMLADKYNEKKTLDGSDWFIQPKLDGLRAVVDGNGGTSRAGKPFFTIQHIVDELQELSEQHNVVFDGELYNHDLKADFEKIVSLVKKQKIETLSPADLDEIRQKVQFHIYDIIPLDNPDMPYEERFALINDLLSEVTKRTTSIVIVPTWKFINPTKQEISDKHDEFFQQGYEGLMMRKPNSKYEYKRTKSLLKYKNFDEAEFILEAMIEGQGNWAGAVKSVVLRLPSGETSEAGVSGSYELNAKILAEEEKYLGGDVTTKFQGYTKDGKLRFGIVKIFHMGKRDY